MSVSELKFITNAAAREDLKLLSVGLKKKQHYEVSKNGSLKVKSHQGFCKRIGYHFKKDQISRKVKPVITERVTLLTESLPAKVSKTTQKELQNLFFTGLAPLSHQVFDRNCLDMALLEILHPELKRSRKRSRNANDPQRRLDRRIEKTRLAINLGIDLDPIGKGASGSYFAVDYKMKKIGVFKPLQEESNGVDTPKRFQRFKNIFTKRVLGIDMAACFWPKTGYLAEVMTSTLADHMEIPIVARSKVATFSSQAFASSEKNKPSKETGSYQIFAKNTKSVDEACHLNSETSFFSRMTYKWKVKWHADELNEKISLREMEWLAIIDQLGCNRDRHPDNLLIQKYIQDGKEKERLVLIDHGLAFPKINPPKKDFFYRANQNKWERFPQCKKNHFSDEIKNECEDKLKGKKLEKLLMNFEKVNPDFTKLALNSKGQNISQSVAFKQRVVVLHSACAQNITLKEYACLKSKEEMHEFIEKLNLKNLDFNDEESLNHYLDLTACGTSK